jgi:Ca2+-binding RTX toxin-like protein
VDLSASRAANNGYGGTDVLIDMQVVIGNASNDTFEGGLPGGDTLQGGTGSNVYWIMSPTDTVVQSPGGSSADIEVSCVSSLTLAANVDRLSLDGAYGAVDGTGNSQNDVIYGDALNDVLTAGAGNDTLLGGAGNDTLIGGGGSNVLSGGGGINTADYAAAPGAVDVNLATGLAAENGYGGSDTLSNIQVVIGSAFNDTFVGGAGNETLNGGGGINTVDFSATSGALDVDLSASRAASNGYGGSDSLSNIQVVIGNNANDTFEGGLPGGDTLEGGTGNNVYWIVSPTDTVVQSPGGGSADIEVSCIASLALAANVDRLSLDGAYGAVDGTGNNQNDIIYGDSLNDVLTAGTGNDTLLGGTGNDTLLGGGGSNVLNGGGGINTVDYASAPGALDVDLAGNLAANNGYGGSDVLTNIQVVIGNNANDTFEGGLPGGDTLEGGTGNNTYWIVSAGDTVVQNPGGSGIEVSCITSLTLAANVDRLSLDGAYGALNGTGNNQNDIIYGDALNNVLTGGAGNDTLIGGAGNNTLNGGGGINTVDYSGAPGALDVDLAASRAANNGYGGIDTLSNIQVVIGNAANDSFEGGLVGGDTLEGGTGNNTYWVMSAGDTVVQNPGGTGIEVSCITSLTLAANVDELSLDGAYGALDGTGNSQNDVIYGDSLNDVLTAGSGNDTLHGGSGNDSYVVNAGGGQDTIINGAGGNTAPSGQLDFGPNIAPDQLWLEQAGSNGLQIDVMGTNESVTIANWFASSSAQLQKIVTSDGSTLDTQVTQLVQAMATFTTNNPGFNPILTAQAPSDTALQTAIANAWHH